MADDTPDLFAASETTGVAPSSTKPSPTGMAARERRVEMALELMSGIIQGAMVDLDDMKRAHPANKRSPAFATCLERMEMRLAVGEREVREARQ